MNHEPKRQPRKISTEPNDERLAQLVDELAEQLCDGSNVDWPACLAQHPHEAAALQQLAPAIEILVMFRKGGSSAT